MSARAFSPPHSCKRLSLCSIFFSTQAQPTTSPLYFAHPSLPRAADIFQIHQSNTNNVDPIQFLKDLSSLTATLSRSPRNYNALTTLDNLLTRAHCFDSATSVFLIHCLSRLRKLGRAKTLLSVLKNKSKVSDYFLYSILLDSLVKDGKIHDVEIMWNEICSFDSSTIGRIDVSDYVIYVCKFGGVSDIRSICKRILLGCKVLKKHSYVALVGALCRANEGLLAEEIVREMYKKGLEVDGLTYFVMFQCFCSNGDLDEADLILRKLMERNYDLDVCVYGNFMHALCKSGKLREANKLFCKLIKSDSVGHSKKIESLKDGRRVIFQLNRKGAVPEIMAYEIYFRSLCSVGRLEDAETLLKKMLKKRTLPEICVYGSFIKALFRAGREEDATMFFKVERKKGIVRADEIARFIIIGLCNNGKVDEALTIFNEVVVNAGKFSCMDICNCILTSYWKLGRMAEAESLFERLQDGSFGQPNVLTYTIMVNGYCNQGDVSKAYCLFRKMLSGRIGVNGTLYEMIIRGFCACGQVNEAHKVLNNMIEDRHLVSCRRWMALLKSMFTGIEDGISFGF